VSARLAWHWTKTVILALALAVLAALPFTGQTASYVVILTAAGVGMTGLATAPHIRKDPRP
jgi:hypothetical protein